MKEKPVHGYIGGSEYESRPDRQYISFDEIVGIWKFVLKDVFLTLGDLCIERVGGYNMGNTISEEGTAVDLTETETRFYKKKSEYRKTKFAIAHLEPHQIIAAHRHVDNICGMSFIHCEKCIQKGLIHMCYCKGIIITTAEIINTHQAYF